VQTFICGENGKMFQRNLDRPPRRSFPRCCNTTQTKAVFWFSNYCFTGSNMVASGRFEYVAEQRGCALER
jgi:hypothetical protein